MKIFQWLVIGLSVGLALYSIIIQRRDVNLLNQRIVNLEIK